MPYDPIKYKTPTGTTLSCKGWIQEAALRMLLNNLNPEVAERPDDLIVYGGRAYTKLREVSLGYQLGAIRGIGDFNLALVGRNLYTITDFLGWDPEVGGSVLNSAGFGSVAGFQYPQTRTFTFTIGTRF
jgi:hypothetical protein